MVLPAIGLPTQTPPDADDTSPAQLVTAPSEAALRLLVAGSAIGIVSSLLPAATVTVREILATTTVTVLVLEDWRGLVGLLADSSVLVAALTVWLYRPGWARGVFPACLLVAVVSGFLRAWLLARALATTKGGLMFGLAAFEVTPGVGAFLTVIAAAVVGVGGLLGMTHISDVWHPSGVSGRGTAGTVSDTALDERVRRRRRQEVGWYLLFLAGVLTLFAVGTVVLSMYVLNRRSQGGGSEPQESGRAEDPGTRASPGGRDRRQVPSGAANRVGNQREFLEELDALSERIYFRHADNPNEFHKNDSKRQLKEAYAKYAGRQVAWVVKLQEIREVGVSAALTVLPTNAIIGGRQTALYVCSTSTPSGSGEPFDLGKALQAFTSSNSLITPSASWMRDFDVSRRSVIVNGTIDNIVVDPLRQYTVLLKDISVTPGGGSS